MNSLMNRLFALCALALLAFPAAPQPIKIGVIEIARIERESKRAQQAIESMMREFASRAQALSDFRAKVETMRSQLDKLNPRTPAAELEKKRREFETVAQRLEQNRRNFEDDLERRKAEERQKLFRELDAVVKKVAEAQDIDLVLLDAVYAGRAVDITDQVVKALDGSQPDAGR